MTLSLAHPTKLLLLGCAMACGLLVPNAPLSAHEVYVLDSQEVSRAMETSSFDMVAVAWQNLGAFVFWAFITILTAIGVFCISILRWLERWLDPPLLRLRPYATTVARVTVGVALLACAYYQAAFGPELPLRGTYGNFTWLATGLLVFAGSCLCIGFRTRIAATIGLLLFMVSTAVHGWYMLMYAGYAGTFAALILLGAHAPSLDAKLLSRQIPYLRGTLKRVYDFLAPRSILILRVSLGIAIISASVYAKIWHNHLALLTVEKFHLDAVLGFEPHFLVLGAAILEVVLGLFVCLGIEIRFTGLFFLFWLIQSLIFFGETVWPHIILFGLPVALFMYGYDRYSVEGYFFRKQQYAPVL